ncbi:hypothetical protein [Celeribacter halophilus]|uniref:hypothetical protein n=1 Tax=Celeribacter halophilus TaxID=576117 RepID=UPI003A912500
MLPFSKFHPASLLDLHEWSTLSRNEIGPFLARFRIQPLGRKFPMLRVYEQLLGLSPTTSAEEDMLGEGLVRVTKVAEWFGISSEVLLDQLRAPNNEYPPLYAFGPKRHLMLKAQVEQMLASPRNAFQILTPIPGHTLPGSRLARHLEVTQSRIDALLAKKADLPARIISQGRVRYIVADVARRLAPSGSEKPPSATENVTHRTAGGAPRGLFSATAGHAAAQAQTLRSCTETGEDARRGDCLHGASAEAKLSKT